MPYKWAARQSGWLQMTLIMLAAQAVALARLYMPTNQSLALLEGQ
jgi:hypothetical protein